jgi:protein-histidine N-methyltransferase
MAEDEDPGSATSSSTSKLSAGLDKSDIETNVYEGGFKTWECSVDLAKLVLDRGPRKDLDDVCRVDSVVEVSTLSDRMREHD